MNTPEVPDFRNHFNISQLCSPCLIDGRIQFIYTVRFRSFPFFIFSIRLALE